MAPEVGRCVALPDDVVFERVIDLDAARQAAELARLCGDDRAQHQRLSRWIEADAARGVADPVFDPRSLAAGSRVGRHVVLEQVGIGASSVVYAAFDPELDRRVAIKLLRSPREIDGPTPAPRELTREGRALARVDHPNVVGVFDVGEIEHHPYAALEFVDGVDLGVWLAAEPRTTAEIVRVLAAVGRGVRAIHECGLVHLDLKPANVMLARSGAVKVMDLGLVHASGAASTSPTDADGRTHPCVGGTPAYMAPEQHVARAVDGRADVFAFCVVAYRALFGCLPFGDDELSRLEARKLAGVLADPTRLDADARPYLPIVTRGLAADPERRWPSMAALIEALERDPRAPRRRRAMAAALGLGAVAALGWWRWDQVRFAADCAAQAREVEAVWNSDRAAATQAGFVATGLPYAAESWDHTASHLEAFARAWAEGRTAACMARYAPEIAARARACFEDRRRELELLLAMLEAPEAVTVREAPAVAVGLGRLQPCSDRDQLARMADPPGDADAAAQDRVRELVLRVDLTTAFAEPTGTAAALAALEQAVDGLDRRRAPALAAEVHFAIGRARHGLGRFAAAESADAEAFALASLAGRDDQAFVIGSAMALLVGHDQGRVGEGRVWQRMMAIAAERAGLEAPENRAIAAYTDGALDEAQGDLDAAALALTDAAHQLEVAYGPSDPELVHVRAELGRLHLTRGDDGAARAALTQAVELGTRLLGEHHVDTAQAQVALAALELDAGAAAPAMTRARAALEVLTQWFGSEGAELYGALETITGCHIALGERELALASAERAVEITAGEIEHGLALMRLAETHSAFGDRLAAQAVGMRAIAIVEQTHRADARTLALVAFQVARWCIATGELAAARRYAEQASALAAEDVAPEHQDAGEPALVMGLLLAAEGDDAAAIESLERAVALLERDERPSSLAEARLALADLLWRDPSRRRDALANARAATSVPTHGPRGARARADARAWLDAHRMEPPRPTP